MKTLKGIVIDTAHGLVKIQTETGAVFWAMPDNPLSIQEHVRISWDYTRNKPITIMSKAKFKEQSQKPDNDGDEIFSIPDDREHSEIENEVLDIEISGFSRLPHDDDDEVEWFDF